MTEIVWRDENQDADVQRREDFLARYADQFVKAGIEQYGSIAEREVVNFAVAALTRQAEVENIPSTRERIDCAVMRICDELEAVARKQRIAERNMRRLKLALNGTRRNDHG